MNPKILQLRLWIAQLMLKVLQLQQLQLQKNMDKRQTLFDTAVTCLGKDMAPMEDEYGCAEAVNQVFKKAFGVEVGGYLSTYRMYQALSDTSRFLKVFVPMAGDIIISPTGYGNGRIRSGHVGIVGENGQVMSNTSDNGLWLVNYNLDSWYQRYLKLGGFPIHYYRVL